MMVCSPISTCARSAIHIRRHIGTNLCGIVCRGSPNFHYLRHPQPKSLCVSISNGISSTSICFQASCRKRFASCLSKQRSCFNSIAVNQSTIGKGSRKKGHEVSFACEGMNARFFMPKYGAEHKIKCNMRHLPWLSRFASVGVLFFGLLISYSSSKPVYAEAVIKEYEGDKDDCTASKLYDGKPVYTHYSVTGIPGDGRCLFRSVAHGACIRSGRPAPNERLQRELADGLRERVAEEYIKRREETEWFVEGDFDHYVSQIRKPHVWGGEPELFLAAHVLQLPISVYMQDEKAGGLICIAEYGQEYGEDNPIRLLYHGFGHYDSLQIPPRRAGKSKL